MIFSKLARSASRSARLKFQSGAVIGNYGARSSEAVGSSSRFVNGNGELGALKNYVSSRMLLSNPSFRRMFSSDSGNKKNYENYFPKGKKEIPKGNENKKSESKEESHTEWQENFMKQMYNYIAPLILAGLILSTFFVESDKKEVNVYLKIYE